MNWCTYEVLGRGTIGEEQGEALRNLILDLADSRRLALAVFQVKRGMVAAASRVQIKMFGGATARGGHIREQAAELNISRQAHGCPFQEPMGQPNIRVTNFPLNGSDKEWPPRRSFVRHFSFLRVQLKHCGETSTNACKASVGGRSAARRGAATASEVTKLRHHASGPPEESPDFDEAGPELRPH